MANVFWQGGKGKSHLWEMLRKYWRIKDSVLMINYKSGKSDASDERNLNGQIMIIDELPRNWWEDKGTDDQQRMLKQLIAQNMVSAKILTIQADGTRRSHVTYSECIGVLFASTNDNLAGMSHAMTTRWYIIYLEQRMGFHRSVLQLKYAEQMLDGNEKVYQRTLSQHEHCIQVRAKRVHFVRCERSCADCYC